MDLRVLVTGMAGFLVIAWCLARGIRQVRAGPKPIIFADPASCKKILPCKGYIVPEEENLYTDVESRAISNKQLILAFEINNSFNASDSDRRREFNTEAVKAIKMTEAKVITTYQTTFTFLARAFQEHRVLRFPSDCVLKSLDACTLDVTKEVMLIQMLCSGRKPHRPGCIPIGRDCC